jgi:hypothetical protein
VLGLFLAVLTGVVLIIFNYDLNLILCIVDGSGEERPTQFPRSVNKVQLHKRSILLGL